MFPVAEIMRVVSNFHVTVTIYTRRSRKYCKTQISVIDIVNVGS